MMLLLMDPRYFDDGSFLIDFRVCLSNSFNLKAMTTLTPDPV